MDPIIKRKIYVVNSFSDMIKLKRGKKFRSDYNKWNAIYFKYRMWKKKKPWINEFYFSWNWKEVDVYVNILNQLLFCKQPKNIIKILSKVLIGQLKVNEK